MGRRWTDRGFPRPFELGTWWVDEMGGFHCADGIDESLNGIFLRHLGQTKVVAEPCRLTVIWDVRSVAEVGLWAVLDRISDCEPHISIGLKFFYYGWYEENFTSSRRAVSRLRRIQQFKDVNLLYSTIIKTQPISNISGATNLIKNGYDLWDRSDGCFSKMTNEQLANYLPHILIFSADHREDNLVYTHVGNKSTAAKVGGPKWVASALNRVSDRSCAPESEKFAEQVSAPFQSILESGDPRFFHVRALMQPEDGEPYWLSYERLLTRHILHDGRPSVVCLVNRSPEIDIPFAGGP